MNDYPTFQKTICNSPQWEAWREHQYQVQDWDVEESTECGWISPPHWQAFLEGHINTYGKEK